LEVIGAKPSTWVRDPCFKTAIVSSTTCVQKREIKKTLFLNF
jgi:hypothetical protein